MYLWLIIATFITAIFALSSSLRHDINELYIGPQAQTVLTKLYVQHRAAIDYVSKHRTNGEGGHGPSYAPGVIGTDDLKGYLPYGFNAESGVSRFVTLTYCLDRLSPNMSTLPTDCSAPPATPVPGDEATETGEEPQITANCCRAPNARTYLISFGCLPMKWQDIRSGRPSGEFLAAMKKAVGFANGLGYVVPREQVTLTESAGDNHGLNMESIETTMGIAGQGSNYYIPIPQYIISNPLPGAGQASFNRVCGDARNQQTYNPEDDTDEDAAGFYDSCDYCLVYMTPF